MKSIALTPFLSLILCLGLLSCGDIRDPELVGIENLGIDRVGLRESAFMADIRYHNPNKFRIKMKEAEGDAWIDGTLLGHFKMDTLVHIQPDADFLVPIQLKMDMKNFMGNLAMIISGKPVNLKIEGSARVGKSLVYVSYPIKYEEKVKLNELLNK